MIIGYRSWWLDSEGWLWPYGVTTEDRRFVWEPGINRAIHNTVYDSQLLDLRHLLPRSFRLWGADALTQGHRSPSKLCSCGIYAHKECEPDHNVSRGACISGTVQLWGKIIEHDRGWRAEFAQIAQLFPLERNPISFGPEVFYLAAQRYDVPVARP